MTKYQLG